MGKDEVVMGVEDRLGDLKWVAEPLKEDIFPKACNMDIKIGNGQFKINNFHVPSSILRLMVK